MKRGSLHTIFLVPAFMLSLLPAYSAQSINNVPSLPEIRLSPVPVTQLLDSESLSLTLPADFTCPGDQLSIAGSAKIDHHRLSPVSMDIGGSEPAARSEGRLSKRLITTGLLLIPLDKTIVRLIPRTGPNDKSDSLTEVVNKLGDGSVLLGLLGGMYLLGDSKDRETSKLAVSAMVNAALISEAIKVIAGRDRPWVSNDDLVLRSPSTENAHNSFPSGHATIAFAVAAVMADRHPSQKWIYYTLASGVGLARIRKSAHFPSDVLVGAGIGVYAAKRSILNGPQILGIRF